MDEINKKKEKINQMKDSDPTKAKKLKKLAKEEEISRNLENSKAQETNISNRSADLRNQKNAIETEKNNVTERLVVPLIDGLKREGAIRKKPEEVVNENLVYV